MQHKQIHVYIPFTSGVVIYMHDYNYIWRKWHIRNTLTITLVLNTNEEILNFWSSSETVIISTIRVSYKPAL